MARKKLSIIGAGNVGATAAHWAASKELADIVLYDIVEGVPQGKALDLLQAAPLEGFDCNIIGTNDFDDTADSDVVIVTAGVARKPGMTRDDLLKTNYGIVSSVVREAAQRSPGATFIIVTNPVDVMTYVAYRVSGLPSQRGSGRPERWIRRAARLSPKNSVFPWRTSPFFVMGVHGDETWCPSSVISYVGGIPIEHLIPEVRIRAIVERTSAGAAAKSSTWLKTGSAYYAPGLSVIEMAEAILKDKRRVLPAIAYLNGEYGQRDVYAGVPVILGAGGVERVIEIDLTPEEREAFERSIEAVRAPLRLLGLAS